MAESGLTASDTIDGHSTSRADWMSKLPSHLYDIPLNQLAIPGSHNSGSFHCDLEAGVSPDAEPAIQSISKIPGIGAIAKSVIHKWSKCQNLNISEQLTAGVRYFDFRVAYSHTFNDFYLVHGLFGPNLFPCLEEIKTFLGTHRKEIVILDLNHFYDMDTEHHLQLLTYLISLFDNSLCPRLSLKNATLGVMWANEFQVIAIYQHDIMIDFEGIWPADAIRSPWTQSADADKCLGFQENAAKQERHEEKFHSCQAVLTPDGPLIMQKFMSSLQVECASKINPRLKDWICSEAMENHKKMIYSVDFVNDDFVQTIIHLNK